MKQTRQLKYPDITKIYVACHDGGFDSIKGMGADVTDISITQLAMIRNRIVKNQFTARTAPVNGMPPDAAGRIIKVSCDGKVLAHGISGKDAETLQPGLWTSQLTADHYVSPVYYQYLFQNLADLFQQSDIASGTHVKVFLSLGINIMHSVYGNNMHETLIGYFTPITIQTHDGKEWYITFGNIEIKEQPFWVMVDQVMRWNEKTKILSPPDLSVMKDGYYVVLDCGSNTFQGLFFANNMIPVDRFCEGIGVWDVVKRQFKSVVVKKAQDAGLTISDPKMQQLMDAYRTGEYRVGKHGVIDIRAEKAEMNRLKIEQRLETTRLYLRTGEDIGNIVFAGGDAETNFPRFQEYYEKNIRGEMKFATDDTGEQELIFRLASGGLKGAIRRWSQKA